VKAYLAELSRELEQVGIRGRLRRRILAESEDHLSSDPEAFERFGSPAELANTFAAELGTRASRRAAVGAFAALAFAGAVFAVSFLSAALAGQPAPDTWPVLAQLALPVLILAPQVSFVAGSLALVRVLRRRDPVLPSEDLTVIHRRTGIALLSGLVTMADALGEKDAAKLLRANLEQETAALDKLTTISKTLGRKVPASA